MNSILVYPGRGVVEMIADLSSLDVIQLSKTCHYPLSIIRWIEPPLTSAAGQNSQYWFICLVFTCKFFRHISYWSSSWLEGLTESQLFWMNRIWESPGAGKVEVCVRFLLCHNLRLRGRFRNTSINLSLKWMTHSAPQHKFFVWVTVPDGEINVFL